MRNYLPEIAIHDGSNDTVDGLTVNVKDFSEKLLTIATAGVASADTLTFKVKGSNQDAIDFSAAKSITNRWDYIAIVDKNSGSTIAGDTGVTIADANDVLQYAINDDGIRFVTVEITAMNDKVNNTFYAYLAVSNENL